MNDINNDLEVAERVVKYLNDLLELDRAAIHALIGNRVPCNQDLALHSTCQVTVQGDCYFVGLLGILNGLCGIKDDGNGYIIAVFKDDPKNPNGFKVLDKFEVNV